MARAPAFGQGIRRTTSILQALGRGPSAGLRLTDVAERTKLNKATVHRLLNALVECGLVEQDESTGHFHLSFELYVLGSAAANRYGLKEMVRPHLINLERKTSDSVYLSIRSGFDAVCVERHEGSYPIRVMNVVVGERRPLGIGATSLAILSGLPDEEIDRVIEANRGRFGQYGMDAEKLYKLVEKTRRNGYAYYKGFVVPEMGSIGMAVLGPDGRVVAAIGLTAIQERMKPERRDAIVEWMRAEVKALETRLAELTASLTLSGIDDLSRVERSASPAPSRASAVPDRRPQRSLKSNRKHRAARQG